MYLKSTLPFSNINIKTCFCQNYILIWSKKRFNTKHSQTHLFPKRNPCAHWIKETFEATLKSDSARHWSNVLLPTYLRVAGGAAALSSEYFCCCCMRYFSINRPLDEEVNSRLVLSDDDDDGTVLLSDRKISHFIKSFRPVLISSFWGKISPYVHCTIPP